MCGWCRIFDSASRIFGKSSTVVSDVEFLMQRIKCINYICLHGSRQTGFFSGWSTQIPCAETQALFIMASTSTACNVCCKTTKYTCLDCGLYFCIPCSVFEWRWRGPGMDGWALCSSMWCVFSRAVGKIGDRGDQVVKERQTPEIGTPDENFQNGKKRNR